MDTFKIVASNEREPDPDCCELSEDDAREFFHRAGGRGLGLSVVNERTGEVVCKDPQSGLDPEGAHG